MEKLFAHFNVRSNDIANLYTFNAAKPFYLIIFEAEFGR